MTSLSPQRETPTPGADGGDPETHPPERNATILLRVLAKLTDQLEHRDEACQK